MKMYHKKLFLLVPMLSILLIIINLINSTNGKDELLSVVVVFRHGDRTPVSLYPNDPYQNKSSFPEGLGQLINKGKERHYELGQWLRNRYNGFLSEIYQRNEIFVRSTDIDRTLMSAAANLAGLYPPQKDQIWNENILWQPIPIHTVPLTEDPLLATEKYCARYNFLRAELDNSEYFQNINLENQALYLYLQENSGSEIKNLDDMANLYTTLLTEEFLNLTLPEWTKMVYPEHMRDQALFDFSIPCFTTELARLKTGVFWGELIKYFRNRIENPEETYKFLMYSAHDTTLANLLNSIEAFEYHIPPYASTLIFEQRQNSQNKIYVSILYKNSDYIELQNISARGCEFNCLIDDFEEHLKPISLTLEEWSKECELEKIRTSKNS